MIRLPCGQIEFERGRPVIMGVLNVTPDSFSDGGRYLRADSAARRARQMIEEGAQIIDVGPESSRPGAEPVCAEEQIRRAAPVIERVRRAHPCVAISIDTRLAAVARAAIDAGADFVNDISALRDDEALAGVIAERGAGVVLMHMQGRPADMQREPKYDDVVAELIAFLRQRITAARSAGITDAQIMIDPGIGFGKTVEHNLTLMQHLERFVGLGLPVVVGASRKRFLAKLTPNAEETGTRLGGSLACVVRAMEAGVQIVRVHDVRETRQLIDTLERVREPR